MTIAVFLSVFALYLRALPPALAPWRDTGEMSLAAATLGVAHPTSYPLYVLLGKLATLFPLGNPAYRLNLLSAVAGAAACALLFALLRARRGTGPALAAAAVLALNPSFWAVSQVSEMYSLWILGAVALIALAERLSEDGSERLWPAFCFLAGLCLTNRLDIVLLAPGLLWLALSRRPLSPGEDNVWAGIALIAVPAAAVLSGSNLPAAALIAGTVVRRSRGEGMGRRLGTAALWGLAGASVYLYLPVRSATGPLLDWNHPAVPANLLDSILRTRYGGTLDLVSRNYAPAAMLADNMRLWGAHLAKAFGPLLLLAVWGAAADAREDKTRFLGRLAAWWWAGPVFLLLANMPPNPHAAAILDPHYLLSDAVLLFWLARGAAEAAGRAPAAAWAAPALAAGWALLLGAPAKADRRTHLHSLDYAANVFRAAPPGSVVVGKKDVQLYSLWHYQTVAGRRPDLRLVSQGLAGAPWYRADWRRRDKDLLVASLKSPEGWAALGAGGRPVLYTQDSEPPAPVASAAAPRGLLLAASGAPAESAFSGELLVRRGAGRVDEAEDFFTADLIESRAMALFREGLALQRAGRYSASEAAMTGAWAASWNFPDAALFLGFLQANAGLYADAAATYEAAESLFAEKLAQAAAYRSLPDVVASVRRQAAEAATHRGVAAEKLGDRAAAEAHYRRALAIFPLAQTRFDLAVLYWNRDKAAVVEHLSEALRLDPNHAQARKYMGLLTGRR